MDHGRRASKTAASCNRSELHSRNHGTEKHAHTHTHRHDTGMHTPVCVRLCMHSQIGVCRLRMLQDFQSEFLGVEELGGEGSDGDVME